MTLDVPTLMLAGAFVALLSGCLLVFAWHHYREMSPVLWWAGSNFASAIGITLLALSGGTSGALVGIGYLFLTIAPALLWTAVRRFEGLRPLSLLLVAGPAASIAAGALPASTLGDTVRALSGSGISATYLLAAAWTLAFRSREKLRARWPLVGLMIVHALILFTGVVAASRTGLTANALPPVVSVFGLIHFEALIFFIGTTIFVVASMRESSEARYRQDAATDVLTGLANRRAFLDNAERLAERCRQDRAPFAVIMLDIDHFKTINDRFGHPFGDTVLRLFADVARKAMRPSDSIGRMGGEEFAAILPGSGSEAACALADRVRKAFVAAAIFVEGNAVNATVSAGVAATEASDVPLETLIKNADAALYRAKVTGRNRTECHREGQLDRPRPKLVRVA